MGGHVLEQHWCARYLGGKWGETHDCFSWFVVISREQFGRDIPNLWVDHTRLLSQAMRGLHDPGQHYPCRPTETPKEGDAVLMTQGQRAHHIGMVVFPGGDGGRLHVLHALERIGVVCTDRRTLRVNGWKIVGYWTPADPAGLGDLGGANA
ncbi:hypothetical protein [Megalodesulfovibrio gigas]|uniref:NlpC/P60 domain-containing protein n=1 Tax=Megalodesulfovibrio gigas (strain ATCC 19364 / DSM 1382 / NCIMB 9332 / VKM B-1759) TaxID=1121448 RepID=T2GA99_MEGG1|nr:hypothetical protein [Megalodesulfovibrio gigas]AGW12847.1 hypothetical protein DGI_0965 [Megalodesulfovibrio gigas DSM 1382 = ATCC 19364]